MLCLKIVYQKGEKMFKAIIYTILFSSLLFGMNFAECKHLLNRTSFGVDKQQLSVCMKENDYESAVKELVYNHKPMSAEDTFNYAHKILRPPMKMSDLKITERKAFQKMKRKSHIALKKYWFETMLKTNDPFLEKMVLFWHNHFTSSLKKVGQASLMYQQNQLFRKYALGNFAALLHAIMEDPAMLIYLDNRANKKSHPNENFARELLELFTLGEGNYSEEDIKALAQALTGYSIDKNFKFKFKKRIHDESTKTFLGQSGNFDAHEMVDIILQQDATAVFIVKKLWLSFIGSDPKTEEVQRLAKLFRDKNYELKPLIQAILTSPSFTDLSERGTMIKSPLELIVGTLRSFDYNSFDSKTAIQYSRRLGQDLLDPPNAKGWSGGESWINTNTLLIRKGFLNRLTRGDAMKDLNYELFEVNTQSKEVRAAEILLPVKVFITPAPLFIQTLRTILQYPLYQLK